MRVLHTSDWHLGVEYFQRSRSDEQQAFLQWLLRVVEERNVDAVVVAGDVFDSNNPPAEAQEAYYRFIAALGRMGRRAIVVGGNHDSTSRLDAPRGVLEALSTTVVGGYVAERESELADPAGVLVPLKVGNEVRAVVCAVPYLHDWRLGVRGFEDSVEVQRASLNEAFRVVYSRLADKAAARYPGVPLLATGHLTCLPKAGDKPTSEDAIPNDINRIGTLGALGPGVFDPRFGYVALGHIHRSFPVDDGRRVWYSGTPVQVGVNEPAEHRNVLIFEISGDGRLGEIERVKVPVTRRLVSITGSFDEVVERLRKLTWPDTELPPYVVVDARLEAVDLGAPAKLRALAPKGSNGSAMLVQVNTSVGTKATGSVHAGVGRPHLDEVTPEAAFVFAWEKKHGGTRPSEAVMQRFRSLVSAPVDGEGERA